MKQRTMTPGAVAAAAFALMFGLSSLAGADEPQPKPTPEPTPVETKRPKSLADLASGIKIQPIEEEKSGSVVISNENLKEMGEGAVVSQGNSIGGSPGAARSNAARRGSGGTGQAGEDLQKEIENLEVQLAAIRKAEAENRKANLYSGSGPQYRAGGVTDPLQTQREDIEKKLSDAQARLAAMEKAAERGRRSGSSSSPAPTPAPSETE